MSNVAKRHADRSTAPAVKGKLAYATATSAPVVPGRREFFKYRDLLVADATNGAMRTQVMSVTAGTEDQGPLLCSRALARCDGQSLGLELSVYWTGGSVCAGIDMVLRGRPQTQ